MLSKIAFLISFIAWLYILIASIKDGCLWTILILLLGPIVILIYVLTTYQGNKLVLLSAFYAPFIVGVVSSLFCGL